MYRYSKDQQIRNKDVEAALKKLPTETVNKILGIMEDLMPEMTELPELDLYEIMSDFHGSLWDEVNVREDQEEEDHV